MAPTTTAAANSTPPPGSLFGLPGLTQRVEQWDSIYQQQAVLSQGAQTPFTSSADFQKTDVIFWWDGLYTWVNTPTVGTGTLVESPYFPFNLIQNFSLKMQGQYKPVDVVSGIDLAIFQSYRPMRRPYNAGTPSLLGSNVPLSTAYPNTSLAQANLNLVPNEVAATSPIQMWLEIPASLYFDAYFDLQPNGATPSTAVGAHVSPQMMGGWERSIRPVFNFAAGFAGNFDQGPIVATTLGTATYAGNVTTSYRRVGVFGSNNAAELPLVYNWQYTRISRQYGWGAQSSLIIPLAGQEYGQILSIFVRLFDPGVADGGAPVNINTCTSCQILYGSSLTRFDDTPQTMQKRFFDQHGFLPPVGVFVWDLALMSKGTISNAAALNTITGANIQVKMQFSSVPSAAAYAVVGIEGLVLVSGS